MMSDLIFYGLAAVLIVTSLLAVSLPNLLHSAIALITSFFATAALYIMLQLEFIALAQIMLYVGGIVIFMILIILLTTGLGTDNSLNQISRNRWVSKGILATTLLLSLVWFLRRNPSAILNPEPYRADPVTIDDIGIRLLSIENGFIVPFEVISLLLLVALIGAVVIARRDKKEEEQS
jgi:NADH-quinone oxidoreductase subunit J